MTQAAALNLGHVITKLYASRYSDAARRLVLEALVALAKSAEAGGKLDAEASRVLSDAGMKPDDRRDFVAQVSNGTIAAAEVEEAVGKALAPKPTADTADSAAPASGEKY
jgi:hypothetical protein